MLSIARFITATLFLLLLALPGVLLCLSRPFHPSLVYWVSRPLGWLLPWFGIPVAIKGQHLIKDLGPCVFVCNHQNSFDLFICTPALPDHAVTLGKKSLLWIPVFGWLYALAGNLMIDRKNTKKANQTLKKAAKQIQEDSLKVWIFPEGTRSYGRGLLRFKTGAFRLAQQAGVPIVPVCVADTSGVSLNRYRNRTVAIEILEPITLSDSESPRVAADKIQQQMAATIDRLTLQAKETS